MDNLIIISDIFFPLIADKIFGEKRRKKIVGPIDWRAPGSKEIIKVYKSQVTLSL